MGVEALLEKQLCRYGFAISCVALPLILALVTFNFALNDLTPDIAQKIKITYVPAQPKPEKAAKRPSSDAATANVTKATNPAAAPLDKGAYAKKTSELSSKAAEPTSLPSIQEPADAQVTADPAYFLRGLAYRGEAQYATASAFIYLASTAVLLCDYLYALEFRGLRFFRAHVRRNC